MQITPILICLVVLSIAQAALVTRIPKPKLNSVLAEKLKTPEIPKHKSPEERRKFSLFPKSYMKYVISPEPIYKIATHKPILHGTKKPLMKKLNLQDNKNKVVENEVEQPMVNEESMNESNLAVNPKVDNVVASEEASIEGVEDKSEGSKEKQDHDSKVEDKLKNDNNAFNTATAGTANKETFILRNHIIPSAVKHNEFSAENKNIDAFVDVMDMKKNSKEIETEFILVDATHKPTESDNVSCEEPEEFVTTEFYEEPEIIRSKRGSNIIEEENLASTVAGYKYTWKDTRLNNDVAFKNIHS